MTSPSAECAAWMEELRDAATAAGGEIVEIGDSLIPEHAPGSIDTVVITVPLELVDDPLSLLRSVHRWLRPTGTLVCAVGNFARQVALVQLLRSDPQEASGAVVDPRARHVHGYATALKLLLEAGYSPDIAATTGGAADEGFLEAARELLTYVRVDLERAARHLAVDHYILVANPIAVPEMLDDGPVPITFVACVNDEAQLKHNLLASPIFGSDSPHELLLYRGMSSAAQGLNAGLRTASHDLVVFVQQDIYLPSWWPSRLAAQWTAASEGGVPAIAGPFGVRYREGGRTHIGHAIDRDHLLRTPHDLPEDVDGLDELVLVVSRDVPLRFDPALGWHLYGTDFVLQARAIGLRATVLDIPCHHNSLFSAVDDAYHHAEAVLAAKWSHELPILTNVSTIDEDPRDVRLAALESQLAEALKALENARKRARTTERIAKRNEAELAEMRQSRSWRYGRRLAAMTGRR